MRLVFVLLVVMLISFNWSCQSETHRAIGENERMEMLDSIRSRALVPIKQMGGLLKSNLMAQLSLDSTGLGALTYCNIRAIPLTESVNLKGNDKIKVRRTALKYRNPSNKPDDLDIEVMKTYLLSKHKKSVDVVETHEGYRVYKPLFIEGMCLKCHGDILNMDRQLVSAIKEKYPNDEAVGYQQGEFRGVIVADVLR